MRLAGVTDPQRGVPVRRQRLRQLDLHAPFRVAPAAGIHRDAVHLNTLDRVVAIQVHHQLPHGLRHTDPQAGVALQRLPRGINAEGLKRRGFDAARIAAIKRAYRALYMGDAKLDEAKVEIAEIAAGSDDVRAFLDFIERGERPLLR